MEDFWVQIQYTFSTNCIFAHIYIYESTNISYKQTLCLLEVTKDPGFLLYLVFQPPLSNQSRAKRSVERSSFMITLVLLLRTATCAKIRETVLRVPPEMSLRRLSSNVLSDILVLSPLKHLGMCVRSSQGLVQNFFNA